VQALRKERSLAMTNKVGFREILGQTNRPVDVSVQGERGDDEDHKGYGGGIT